jgi:hypothetical protein
MKSFLAFRGVCIETNQLFEEISEESVLFEEGALFKEGAQRPTQKRTDRSICAEFRAQCAAGVIRELADNPHLGTRDWREALDLACTHGYFEIAQRAISAGANVCIEALRTAATHGHTHIIDLLIPHLPLSEFNWMHILEHASKSANTDLVMRCYELAPQGWHHVLHHITPSTTVSEFDARPRHGVIINWLQIAKAASRHKNLALFKYAIAHYPHKPLKFDVLDQLCESGSLAFAHVVQDEVQSVHRNCVMWQFIAYMCKYGDLASIKQALDTHICPPCNVLSNACTYGHMDIIMYLLKECNVSQQDMYAGLVSACRAYQIRIVTHLLGLLHGIIDWTMAFTAACESGSRSLIKMIGTHITPENFQVGYYTICRMGYFDLVDLFTVPLDSSYIDAICTGGNMTMINRAFDQFPVPNLWVWFGMNYSCVPLIMRIADITPAMPCVMLLRRALVHINIRALRLILERNACAPISLSSLTISDVHDLLDAGMKLSWFETNLMHLYTPVRAAVEKYIYHVYVMGEALRDIAKLPDVIVELILSLK